MTPYIVGISISSSIMLIILGLLIFFHFRKNSSKNKLKKIGLETEQKVNQQVQFWSHKNNGVFIPATMFKYHNNKIFEVDGILITQRALIVIEVKNIKGTIRGKGNEKTWLKVLGPNQFEIKSPIFQNDKHIEHIFNMTKIKVPTISLIVFESETLDKLEIEDVPEHAVVISSNEIEQTLDGINSLLMPKITKNEIGQLYSILSEHKTNNANDKKMLTVYAKEYNDKTFTI